MDVIFLTGAGSEPGQSIARRLVGAGFRVYGLAAQFPPQGLAHRDFVPVAVNLADSAAVRAEVEAVLAKENTVFGAILAGNYPVEEPFEATHAEDIATALNAGVASPLTLVRQVLPQLVRRRGYVVALTRAPTGAGAVLAATVEGALRQFTRELFAELRDTGVKTAQVRLEGNSGAPDPAARFTQAPQSQVQADIVADAVESIFRLRENNALTELVLRPQATREEPRLPISAEPRLRAVQVVQLPPPQNFPPPREIILTPERKRPDYAPPPGAGETDDWEDEEDFVDPELRYLLKSNRNRGEEQPSRTERDDRQPEKNRGRERPPRDGALRVHPPTDNRKPQPPAPQQRQSNGAPAPERNFLPYPEKWHWPRPPSQGQLDRLARRRAQDERQRKNSPLARVPQKPAVASRTAEPVPEFVPPPPRDLRRADIPEFVPPVAPLTVDAPVPEPSAEEISPAPKTDSAPVQAEDLPKEVPVAESPVKPAKKTPRKKVANREVLVKKDPAKKATGSAAKTPARRVPKKPASE